MRKKDIKFLDLCLYFCGGLIVFTLLFAAFCFLKWQTEPSGMMEFIAKICSAEGVFTTILAIIKMKNEK